MEGITPAALMLLLAHLRRAPETAACGRRWVIERSIVSRETFAEAVPRRSARW